MALCTGLEPVSPVKSAAFREQCVTNYTNTANDTDIRTRTETPRDLDYCHLSKMIPYHLGLCRHFSHYY